MISGSLKQLLIKIKEMKTFVYKVSFLVAFGILISTQAYSQKGVEDGSKYGHGEDSVNCIKNLSLYYEFFKHKNYKDAILSWRPVFNECPASSKNLYLFGIDMYKNFLETATDVAIKNAYCDTIMMLHDSRIKYFGEEGKVLGYKGIDLLRYRRSDGVEFIKQGYEILKKSMEIENVKSQPAVVALYMTASISLFMDKQIQNEQVINDYIMASEILDEQLKKSPSSRTQQAKEAINKNISDSKALTCEAIVKIFSPKYEANKDNINFLKLISGFLNDSQCESENLFTTISERLYEIEPSAEAAYNIARLYFKKNDYNQAKAFYLEAIKGSTNDADKANYYYELGIIYSSFLKQPKEAVECGTEASRLKPDWGDPFILLGQSYVLGKDLFNDNFQQQTVFWVAVDMFQKAKIVDPSVAEKATGLIKEYSNYFPSKEDVFFRTLADGQSYTVGGWINKSTTVRAR